MRKLIALVALLAVLVLPACGGTKTATGLPNVVGQRLDAAKETLADAGYSTVSAQEIGGPGDMSRGFERDYLVKTQDPVAGSDIANSDPIQLGVEFQGEPSPGG
jgi:beta-lactam-binding protein with PASTA domain